jgi:hypothetical protein
VNSRVIGAFFLGWFLCLSALRSCPAEAASDDAARAVRALERIAHALEREGRCK